MSISLADVSKHFYRAEVVVRDAHADQFRADQTTPYVEHPVEVARRVHDKISSMAYPEVKLVAGFYGLADDTSMFLLVALLTAIGHDVKEDKPGFPLRDRWLAEGIPAVAVDLAIKCIDKLSNTTGGDYLDYIISIRDDGDWIVLLVKEEDMNVNWEDIKGIPSKGRQKAMRTKYLLAHYILFERKPYAALR